MTSRQMGIESIVQGQVWVQGSVWGGRCIVTSRQMDIEPIVQLIVAEIAVTLGHRRICRQIW